jgi:hypothetical protein
MNWKQFCFIAPGIEIALLAGCSNPPPVTRAPYPDPIIVSAPGANAWTTVAAPGKDTPFQDYDKVVVDTINEKWTKRLDTPTPYKIPPPGQVVVKFRLHSDGTVSHNPMPVPTGRKE